MEILSRRLEDAERNFAEGKYGICFQATHEIIKDLAAVTALPGAQPSKRNQRSLQTDQHLCADGCICKAAVVLCVQVLFELHRYSLVDDLLLTYYQSLTSLPFEVFVVWLQLKIHLKEYEQATTTVRDFLSHEQFVTTRTEPRLNPEQYSAIIELLVFHVMVPLGGQSIQEAMQFLQDNTRLVEW
eukprot:CAMPEP_0175122632 /NCGR_PEP_ID=MMETSP0087-20121206/1819_1 /TAXON_ID=136419 /ORGANISM="Unknown Unknown, Strain D1" /LENGTH=184 /DNA_ID=CAMNT_0016404281 /DNA_START=46 /DNA_END=597 /DNA_ORIENTATION=+